MALGRQLREARERQGLTTSQVAAATRMKTQIVEAIEREEFGKIAAPIYGKGFIKLYAELVGADPRPLLQEYVERLSEAAKTPSLVSEGPPKRPAADPFHAGHGKEPAHPAAAPLHPDESHVQLVESENEVAPAPAADEEPDLFTRAARVQQQARPAARPPPPPAPPAPPARPPPVQPAIPPAPVVAPVPPPPPAEARPAPPVAADEPGAGPEDRMSAQNLWQSPIRAASIVIGLVLLIVLVISTLSRCVVSPKPSQGTVHRTELQVVVQPPEPYFD